MGREGEANHPSSNTKGQNALKIAISLGNKQLGRALRSWQKAEPEKANLFLTSSASREHCCIFFPARARNRRMSPHQEQQHWKCCSGTRQSHTKTPTHLFCQPSGLTKPGREGHGSSGPGSPSIKRASLPHGKTLLGKGQLIVASPRWQSSPQCTREGRGSCRNGWQREEEEEGGGGRKALTCMCPACRISPSAPSPWDILSFHPAIPHPPIPHLSAALSLISPTHYPKSITIHIFF